MTATAGMPRRAASVGQFADFARAVQQRDSPYANEVNEARGIHVESILVLSRGGLSCRTGGRRNKSCELIDRTARIKRAPQNIEQVRTLAAVRAFAEDALDGFSGSRFYGFDAPTFSAGLASFAGADAWRLRRWRRHVSAFALSNRRPLSRAFFLFPFRFPSRPSLSLRAPA